MNAKLRLVALLLTAERYAECEPLVRDALEMKRAKQPEDWTRWFAETLLGTTLAARKNFTDAEPLLLAGYKGMEARKSKMDELDTFRLDESRRWLAALYRAWGKPESALPWEK